MQNQGCIAPFEGEARHCQFGHAENAGSAYLVLLKPADDARAESVSGESLPRICVSSASLLLTRRTIQQATKANLLHRQ